MSETIKYGSTATYGGGATYGGTPTGEGSIIDNLTGLPLDKSLHPSQPPTPVLIDSRTGLPLNGADHE